MPPTTIREAPALDSFTPLAEHQSQTPASFYGAKPVLHLHLEGARAVTQRSQIPELPIFTTSDGPAQAEASSEEAQVVETVDIFVSSESLVLFNAQSSIGFSIPYPSISLHAIQRLPDPSTSNATQEIQGLYMQLSISSPTTEEEDEEPASTELTLLLPSSPSTSSTIQDLFTAISNCADLHPDPSMDEDEEMGDDRIMFEGNVGYEGISGLPGAFSGVSDGGLPPPFPGSGGWITAENVGEYFDADGNWIGEGAEGEEVEVLGEGAGKVRGREETDAEEPTLNGHEDGEESKRARVE